mgnify:CR=1 FL=1
MNMVDHYQLKLNSLLELIKVVDRNRIKSPLSDYTTVQDMLNKTKTGSRLTSSQLNLIKDIYKAYTQKYEQL